MTQLQDAQSSVSYMHRQALYFVLHFAQNGSGHPDAALNQLRLARAYETKYKMSDEQIEIDTQAAIAEAVMHGLQVKPSEKIEVNAFTYILSHRIRENSRNNRIYAGATTAEVEAIADAVRKTRRDAAKLGIDIEGIIASLIS